MKNGKRTRRAVIRLRHALAAEKFVRWYGDNGRTYRTNAPKGLYRLPAWHNWHALGCP